MITPHYELLEFLKLTFPAGKVARTTPSHSHTEAGTVRKRAQRACSQCHAHKTKCSGDLPRCKRCEAGNLSCEYTPAKRKFANVRFNTSASQGEERQSSTQVSIKSEDAISPVSRNNASHFPLAIDTSSFSAEELLFRKDIILKHLDAYFDYLYHIPCMGFFHPETAYAQVHDGTFDPATAAAMVAVASFFVNPSEAGREFAMKCSDEVEFYVFRNIYRFAEETLILYALNGVFNLLNGSFAKVWQCYGIAVRLMLGLQVNWDVLPRNRTFAQQECLRRIVWQFFYMDRLLAGGYEEYISCRDDIMKIRLPCNEAAFRDNRTVVVERLHDKSGKNKGAMGLHGYQLRIIDIRHRILILTRKLGSTSGASRSRVEPSKVMADINTLQNELSRFNASLPDEFKLNDQNIVHYMASEEGPGYCFLHCSLGASHLDLYSLSLPGLRERISGDVLRKLPHEFIAKSQKQAIAHALCLSRFCDTIQREVEQRPNNGKLKLAGDPSILNVTTQCLRILLTALQHGFYLDLTLADHTTAPLWRNEPADEPHIRGLIDSLLRISESWCRVIPKAQHYHATNTAAVEQFNKTRKFADQRGIGGNQTVKATGNTRLPGPHHILDNAFMGTVEDEQRSKAGDAAAADRWFRTPQPSSEPVAYPLPEGGFDIDYGPPGVPMFLAQARGVSLGPTDTLNMYDAANDLLSMSSKMIPMGDFSSMLPPGNHLGMASEGVPLMHMDGNGDAGMFHTQQPSHPQYIPQQHGMFMDGYAHYPDGQADSTTYMQQNGFG
ncbi:Fc.00g110700.m01.CDS01 [Cosmosporella sp. VM-42]